MIRQSNQGGLEGKWQTTSTNPGGCFNWPSGDPYLVGGAKEVVYDPQPNLWELVHMTIAPSLTPNYKFKSLRGG